MNQKVKLFLTVALLAVVLGGAAVFYQKQSAEVEQPQTESQTEETISAIDFNVQNQEGKNTYLSDFYDGKPIILNFWTSTCPPCRQEMPDYQSLYDKYQDDVHFVMINCVGSLGETKENAREFLEEEQYTFPVYYDVNQNAMTAYGIRSFPTTYIINGSQKLVAGGTGMIDEASVSAFFEELLGENEND